MWKVCEKKIIQGKTVKNREKEDIQLQRKVTSPSNFCDSLMISFEELKVVFWLLFFLFINN